MPMGKVLLGMGDPGMLTCLLSAPVGLAHIEIHQLTHICPHVLHYWFGVKL